MLATDGQLVTVHIDQLHDYTYTIFFKQAYELLVTYTY